MDPRDSLAIAQELLDVLAKGETPSQDALEMGKGSLVIAQAKLAELAAEDPDEVAYLGKLGTLAVRLGNKGY